MSDRFDDPRANDVAAAPGWLAWTHAWLDDERVIVQPRHRDRPAGPPRAPFGDAWSTRPSLAAGNAAHSALLGAAVHRPDGALVAGMAQLGGDPEASVRAVDFVAPTPGGDVFETAVAWAHGEAWLAFDSVSPDARHVYLTSGSGDGDPSAAIDPWSDPSRPARAPRLAVSDGALWIAWLEASGAAHRGHVCVARLDPAGAPVFTAQLATGDAPQHEAPTLAAAPDGGVVVAWHARWTRPAGGLATGSATRRESVRRWLHLAAIERDGAVRRLPLPAPSPITRTSAGEDQGWEFPALAVIGDEWRLAGRSSQGWHAARGTLAGAFGSRVRIDAAGWGGRGRAGAWLACGAFARRDRRNLAVDAVAWPSDDVPAVRAAVFPAPAGDTVRESGDAEAPPAGLDAGMIHGDIHQHTIASDGTGSVDDALQAAVDRGWGVTAITDHDRFCHRAIGPLTWRRMWRLADRYTASGRILALRAYEFTGARPPGPGHKNVYFVGDGIDGEALPATLPEHTTERLRALLAAHPAIVIPHHLGFTGADAEHHDPEIQPVWELCSVHGTYEAADVDTRFPARHDVLIEDQWARTMLERGLRFGFVGGSDNHGLVHHHGVCPKRDPSTAGLLVVLDAPRDRRGLLDALAARRCYATTGATIGLRTRLAGAPMGSALELAPGEHALEVTVTGVDALHSLTLVRHGGEETVAPDIGADGIHRWRGTFALAPGERTFAYWRVVRADGEMAWSSPCFLDASD